jgi:RiboL-PSP-HEPN
VASIIDRLYSDTSQLLSQLSEHGDLSMQSFVNSNLRKVLLLSAASWFEVRISAAVERFSTVHSNGHPGIEALIKRKAVERQYHTYFDWKNEKPGPFYSLFGDVCGGELKELVNDDAELKDALAAFLELGNLRNELVHGNFAAFPFNKTAEEVYALYQRADKFVVFVETKIGDQKFGRALAANAAQY